MEDFLCLFISFLLADTFEHARQRGTEDVTYYLSKEVLKGNVTNILFLTPCHATPYYSTVHHNIPMRFLDCSPRFELWKFGTGTVFQYMHLFM